MTAETDIAAVDDGGANTAAEVRTALTSTLNARVPADSWMANLFNRPSTETAHTDDQEFDVDDTASATAVTPTGTAVFTVDGHVLGAVYEDQDALDVAALMWPLTPVAAPVTIQTSVVMTGNAVDNNNPIFTGLVFSDGVVAGSNMLFLSLIGADQIRVRAVSGTFTNAVTTEVEEHLTIPLGRLFIRLIWSAANTFKLQVSSTGTDGTWTDLGLGSFGFTLTPTHFGPGASSWATTLGCSSAWEYVRVTESDLSL